MAGYTDTTNIFQERLEDLVAKKKKELNLTQTQIAKEIDITPSSFSDYLNSKKECGINNLKKIAEYFEVSTDYLLGLIDTSCLDTDIKQISRITGLSFKSICGIIELHEEKYCRNGYRPIDTVNMLFSDEFSSDENLPNLDFFNHLHDFLFLREEDLEQLRLIKIGHAEPYNIYREIAPDEIYSGVRDARSEIFISQPSSEDFIQMLLVKIINIIEGYRKECHELILKRMSKNKMEND